MPAKLEPPPPPPPLPMPQEGGRYIRNPDGSLTKRPANDDAEE